MIQFGISFCADHYEVLVSPFIYSRVFLLCQCLYVKIYELSFCSKA